MKKLLKLTLVLVVITCILLTSKAYAASFDCNLEIQTSKTTYTKGEEFIANVYLSNINSEKGVIALQATLEYNKNDLTIIEMNGKNGWDTPVADASYNPANGKMALTRNALGKDNEVVFEIKFKVNNTSASSSSITLKDVIITNGDDAKDFDIIKKDLLLGTGDSGNQGGNSGNQGGNSGNQGGNSGNQGGNSGNQGGNSGNQGGNSGNQGSNNGNQGGNSGNQGGNSGNQGTNNGSQGGNNNGGSNKPNTSTPSGSTGSTSTPNKQPSDNKSKNDMPKTGPAKHPFLIILSISAMGAASYFYVNMKYAYQKRS